jgi:hypothetical protein
VHEGVDAARLVRTDALDQRSGDRSRLPRRDRVEPRLADPLGYDLAFIGPVRSADCGAVDWPSRAALRA